MSEYKFTLTKVICGDLVEGRIHLGLGVSVDSRVSLVGIESYATRLDKSVSDEKERVRRRELGLKSKKRLKEILQRGKAQPEGLYIKYIYARDLYNNQPGQNPWTGWQGASGQLLKEELVNHSSL